MAKAKPPADGQGETLHQCDQPGNRLMQLAWCPRALGPICLILR